MLTVVVLPQAKIAVEDTFCFYEERQNGLGERFLTVWERQIELIQHNPKLFQVRYKSFRQVLLKPFPYLIIYDIEDNELVIYNLIYAGRRPRSFFLAE
jgi:hypothetical protein